MGSNVLFLILFTIFFSFEARASLSASFFGTYITDDFQQSTTTQDSKQLYGGLLLASIDSKEKFHLGFAYSSMSAVATPTAGTTNTFSTVDMGPAFAWKFGRDNQMVIEGAFNVVTTAQYKAGSSTLKEWKGTGYWVAAGAEIQFSKTIYLGGRLIYYTDSYVDQKIGSAASTVSVNRSWVMPVLTLTFRK